MSNDLPIVLCVDDEPRVLDGLETVLEWDYDVRTASSGAEGLTLLDHAASEGRTPSVVISDMRMPGLDGAQFLSRVRQRYPDVSRMLLTGYAELEAAMSAVNDGAIYRMLLKPCPPDSLIAAVAQGVEQCELIRRERALLEETLHGAVGALVETLAIAAPLAFSRERSIRRYMDHLVRELALEDAWIYRVASSVVLLGLISVPEGTLERYYSSGELNQADEAMLQKSYRLAHDLIAQIPRLEEVAQMVLYAGCPEDAKGSSERVALGAKLLRFVLDIDLLVVQGTTLQHACAKLRPSASDWTYILHNLSEDHAASSILSVSLDKLDANMTLEADVRSKSGRLLVKKGQVMTATMIDRLRNFDKSIGVVQPLFVCYHS